MRKVFFSIVPTLFFLTIVDIQPTQAQESSQLIAETWRQPAVLAWKPAPAVVLIEDRPVAKINQVDATLTILHIASLDSTTVRGKILRLKTRVRGESISEKESPWNGAKLMLRVKQDSKFLYPQFNLPVGTFGWTEVSWNIPIPEDAAAVDLIIGLEKVSGTVWFDAIQISVEG